MKKILTTTLILGTVLLAGCSSKHAKIDQLQTDIGVVNQKVDALQNDVNGLRQDVEVAKSEAARANLRLDNQVKTYRK
ncbi:TPA: murein lipoprotein [Escherichia coli]|jgi:murein lipoprotein|nr:murein lipoprotein [Escherichia coli]